MLIYAILSKFQGGVDHFYSIACYQPLKKNPALQGSFDFQVCGLLLRPPQPLIPGHAAATAAAVPGATEAWAASAAKARPASAAE